MSISCRGLSGRDDGPVRRVNVFWPPAALNFDDRPGADGFTAKVFLVRAGSNQGSRIGAGSLEIVLYDGTRHDDLGEVEPHEVWSFAGDTLERRATLSKLGAGVSYNLALRWKTRPNSADITLLARYIAPDGRTISSAPVALAVSPAPRGQPGGPPRS